MNTEDNTILEPFEDNINDHFLHPKYHEKIQSHQNYQMSLNIPNSNIVRKDKHFKGYLDPEVCLDENSKENQVIEHRKLTKITQKQENSGSNTKDQNEKNQKWLSQLQNKQLQESQVDMKERQKEIEKSIRNYEFEYRMLKCYYYLKYLIPIMVILVPLLLYVNREN